MLHPCDHYHSSLSLVPRACANRLDDDDNSDDDADDDAGDADDDADDDVSDDDADELRLCALMVLLLPPCVMLWKRWCCAAARGGAYKQAGGGCRGEGAASLSQGVPYFHERMLMLVDGV